MHFAISATRGPTDPNRAMLPFLFAARAVQAGDRVTLMLFHDAVLMAVEGAGAKLVPVGPPTATTRSPPMPTSRSGAASRASRCADFRGSTSSSRTAIPARGVGCRGPV
jgi:hypothetical protein